MNTDNTTTKICTCCKQEKLKYVDFAFVNKKNRPNPQVRPQCRECRSKVEMQRRNRDEGSRQAYLQRSKDWRDANKSKINDYHVRNREDNLKRFKEYREKNKENIKESKKAYYSKPENKLHRNAKDKERKKEDISFRLMANIRTRIHNVLKSNKCDKTDKLLGCTKIQLIEWLSQQFSDDMSWNNYAKLWQIDHVIPLAFFDLTDLSQQKLAFNWSNLRPLYSQVNLEKNDSIIEEYVRDHVTTFNRISPMNSGYQVTNDTCWCLRFNISGNNSQDERSFQDFLKWTISI
jgi:hypothetical protein